ncbi:GGDEF domain-containing protein [Actinoplanes sp. NPDC051851]|uniref:GGDEF domain-containing protein n=1 Tax=Actinoplanes sp. NPDC051851 TaxID=3154753 RepID=UPI00342758C0
MERAAQRRRRHALRSGLGNGLVPAVLTTAYAIGTWHLPHRTEMLALVAVMLVTALTCWVSAGRLCRTRWWGAALLGAATVNLIAVAALALLDGGVSGPLGAFIPASTVLLATVVPPRPFLGVALLSGLAYALVVLLGDPAPPGYWLVHALGFGGAALLCLRHAGVLGSLRRRLAESSRTDPLTGCLNRRGFDDRLAAEIEEGHPVALVLLDLDHFKQVNDAYGHRAGDELLAWTGRELRGLAGPGDVVGRLGGDEFALLLTGPRAAGAPAVVDGIRALLRDHAPASLGVARFPEEARDAVTLAAAADGRLYADKAARERCAPTAAAVAEARARIGEPGRVATVAARERLRHSIADPGRMAMAQTVVAAAYLAFFAVGKPHWAAMAGICAWGFTAGVAVVLGADWLSRSPLARPLMLAFSLSSFVSCAAIAVLDGGVDSPLGIGMLLSIPLLMLGMRPRVATPVAIGAGLLYLLVASLVGGPGFWYVAINLTGTTLAALVTAGQGRAAARQRRLLTRLGRVDVLTDLLNRRGFSERFETRLGYVRRAGHHATLIIVDLDEFKQLNDVRGHAAGDELLRWVAGVLRASVGPQDTVGRLGGDEFVALVEGEAGETVARIRSALAERTGASLGAALLDLDGADFDTLYAAADARLYEEKNGGEKRGEEKSGRSGARRGLDGLGAGQPGGEQTRHAEYGQAQEADPERTGRVLGRA